MLKVAGDTTLGEVVTGAVGELSDSIFTVEEGSSLFERATLGLDEPEPDIDELEDEPDGVDEVVLPLEGSEGDGVGVLVEDDGTHDGEVHDRETLGTDEVGQDLDGVGDEKWCVGDGVETVKDEDECEQGTACRSTFGSVVRSRHGRDDCVGDKHTTGGDDEEGATTSPLDTHRSGDSDGEVVDGEDTIDEGLIIGAGDTDTVEHPGEVVGDEAVSRPLGEDTDTDLFGGCE